MTTVEPWRDRSQMGKALAVMNAFIQGGRRMRPSAYRQLIRILLIGLATLCAGMIVSTAQECALYPLALSSAALTNVSPGTALNDVLQGPQAGNFGWLTWAGSPSEPTLVASLTAPGNSSTFVHLDDSSDRQLSIGDWVRGKPGVSNSKAVRDALDALKPIDITVPVCNEVRGQGDQTAYRVVAFARVRLLGYQLPGQNRISARFLGYASCADQNFAPVVNAGPDLNLTLPAMVTLDGRVSDDGLPVGGLVTQVWSVVSGPGSVTFGDSNAPVTTVNFTLAGTYVLRMTASDSQLIASDEVVILVNRENHPPAAHDQSVTNDEDTAVVVLLQATDPDGDSLTYIIDTQPQHGEIALLATNAVRYTPAPDYAGPDLFSFHSRDGVLDSAIATVTLTNRPVNDPPVADAVEASTDEDTPMELHLSGSDVEGVALNFTLLTLPASGSLTGLGGNYLYSPGSNFHGSDSFTYVADDGVLTSHVATVSITVSSINDRPVVFTGPDQLLRSPDVSAQLNGVIDDVEFIDSQSLTTIWNALSGPGTVTFANSNLAATTATFSMAGVYVLELVADDGFLSARDELVIMVNQPPLVHAGTDQTNTFPALVNLAGAAVDIDGVPTNSVVTVTWEKLDGPGEVTFGDLHSTNTTASFSQSGIYRLRLTAADTASAYNDDVIITVNRPPLVDAGSDQASTNLQLTLHGTVNDDGIPAGVGAAPLWIKVSGPGTVEFDNASDPGTVATFGEPGIYVLRLEASDSLEASGDEVVLYLNGPPSVGAGSDQTNSLDHRFVLQGAVTDDGLPLGSVRALTWTVASGPEPVSFDDMNNAQTEATFYGAGTYVLRLSATDSELITFDEVTIVVLPPNQAPVVSAGQGQLVLLPSGAMLAGVVADDALPPGSSLYWSWSKVSGPGSVSFADALATNTLATFSSTGNYVLRLTATDSAASASEQVTIAVRTPAMNEAPVANAGVDKVVGLTNALNLRGKIMDDGLPQGAPLTAQWSKVSGPGIVTFANGSATNTQATFSALGTYVLRLTASDSALTDTDEVNVTVYPYNLPPVVNAGADQEIIVPDPALLRSDAAQPTNGMISLSRSLSSTDHWNPSIGQPGLTVHPIGGGTVGISRNGLAVENGAVHVAGTFAFAGTNRVGSLAKWDGTNWSGFYDPRPDPYPSLEAGTNIGWGIFDCHGAGFCGESFECVAVRGQEVFGGGSYLKNLTVPSDNLVGVSIRWSGSGWEPWAFKRFDGQIRVIQASGNKVYLGGSFVFQPTNASPLSFPSLPISHDVAVWDGTNWSALGNGILDVPNSTSGQVFALAIGPTDTVYAAGTFVISTPLGWATNIARWTGTQWEPVGGGILGRTGFFPAVNALEFSANGDLYASGAFTNAGGVPANNIARWDGTNWWSLGAGPANGANNTIEAIAIHGRDVYVGGPFSEAGGFPVVKVARWNGEFWRPLPNTAATNTPQIITAMAGDETGVYFGGLQTAGGGLHVNGITKWEFAEPPPLGVLLQGQVTDDGLPTDAPLTAQWTKVSGPGSVTFSNPTGAVSYARFSAVGTYVLRLTASDTDLSGLDEVTITVRGNQPPAVSAGLDQTVGRFEPVVLRGAVADDGLPEGASVLYQWSLVSPAGGAGVTFTDRNATNTTVEFSTEGHYLLRLTANDSHFTIFDEVLITVSGFNLAPSLSFQAQTTPGLPGLGFARFNVSDDGFPFGITNLLWTQITGPALVAFSNATAAATHITFTAPGSYQLRLMASDTELTTSFDLNFFVTGLAQPPLAGNTPPVVNAGANFSAVAREPFRLNAMVSDDGLPAGGTLSQGWSVVGFTDRVFFSDSGQRNATAVINTPGSYTLRYAANDGQMGGYDDVVVTVFAPTNEPPLAFAGMDVEVTRPDSVELSGVILDDGLPLPYSLAVQWTKINGPGNVIFNPGTTNTSSSDLCEARFTAPGTYVLSLTASDGQFADADEITVTVHEGINSPPAVNAGSEFVAILNALTPLQTTATDDGLPDGLLEVGWSKVSGPGGVSFSTLNGIYQAFFDTPGSYVLRLSATDFIYDSTDDVEVTVYDSPTAPTVAILSPLDAGTITAPTIVTGTVSSVVLQSWTLEYRLKPAEDSLSASGGEGQSQGAAWITLVTANTTITAGPLATFDPTLLLNGIYELRLTATDILNRTSTTDPVTLIVDRNMKVGHFTLSFNDLTIPVAGIPIQVTRTYDSSDKRMGDFGVGWTLDLKNIRLQKNRHLGRAWDQSSSGGLFPTYCIDTTKPRVVTITFPDGKAQKFEMVLAPTCQTLAPLIYPDVVFVPVGGNTRGTLTPLFEFDGETVPDDQLVFGAFAGIPGRGDFISFERLVNPPPGPADNLLFNPDLFEFRSPEGYRYILSETNGLRSVTDPNGNTLTIATNGIAWTNSLSASGGEGQGEVASLSVVFQRDSLGRITNIVDALGHALTYRYDPNGNLVAFTDRDGNTNAFTYDGSHSLLTLSDGEGVQTLSNDYDDSGRLLANTDAFGHSVGYSYDLANQRTFTTNRLGFVTVNEFDGRGNVVRSINPLGAVSSFVYDENDNLLVKSNANGCACAVSYTYDRFDNRTSETDARGNTTTYTYNGLQKVLTSKEPSGFATTNTYDANGNLLSTRDSSGQVATFTYNSAGKVTTLTDSKGNVARFAYDATGFLTNEVNALGHVTEYTVDANGNRLSQTATWNQVSAVEVAQAHRNSQGWMEASTTATPVTLAAATNTLRLVMRHEYTPSGMPRRTLYYDGSSTSVAYNKAGEKESVTDQTGRVTSYQYDDQGRVQTVTHPSGCEERFEYDAEGQVIGSTDRRGFDTRFTYDPAGRLIHTLFADGSQISATHFADGSLHTETAKNGEVTRYEIDADGNRISVSNSVGVTRYTYNYKKFATSKIDPLGRTNLYEYDALGRSTNVVYPDTATKTAMFSGKLLTGETDQNGRTTSYSYDEIGRLVTVTNAAGGVTRYAHDELGNKTSETDPRGFTTFFEYDSMKRLVRTVYPDGTSQSTQYDVKGRALARTDQDNNVTRFGHDAEDNVAAVTNAIGGVTRFTYDCGGNKLSQIDPDGRSIHFEYDSLSRLTNVSHSCGTTEATAYDLAGRVIARTDANGQTTRFAYDLRNNLVAVIDPLIRTNTFACDAAGNRRSETDPSGQTTTFVYDGLDRRIRTIHPDGAAERFAYDGTGRFVSHTNQQGKVTAFQNDSLGRIISITDPLGRVTRYGYDANGNRTAETNANHFVTRHEYDEMNRPTRTIYPDGSTITLSHDRLGRRVSETDTAGHTTLFAFDELGRFTGRQDHLGNITRFGYDAVGRLTSQTDASNQTTTFDYDCLGRRNRIVHPDGTVQNVVFDSVGRRLSETDANTNSTHFAYDVFGRMVASTNALGHVTQFGYDELDRLVSRTDAIGRTTTFEYDALGRRTRTVHPDGAAQTAGYDAKGHRIRETDPAGHSTFYTYDDNGRLTAVTNALNEVTLYGYDATGRLVSQTDALGRTTTFEYDSLDRRTRTVFVDGTAQITTYDALGRRVGETDQANVSTAYGYDAIGRLVAVTNALGQATLYGYDPVGRLVAQTNANGRATTFAYDSLGRRVARTLPGGQTETYGYDPAGNLIARTNFNGRVISYDYDALNRVTAKVPDAQLLAAGSVPVTYAYNAVGLRTNMTDTGGVTDYAYDLRDRLAAKTLHWSLLSTPTTLNYGYDTNGNLAAIRSSNPNGTDVTYTNDALNRLSVAHESRLGSTTYSYDPVGNLQRFTHPNGLQSRLQFDSLNRLTNFSTVDAQSSPLARYEYTVGPAGHRLGTIETLTLNSQLSTLNRSYSYDPAYRITEENITAVGTSFTSSQIGYSYDAAGNRLSRTTSGFGPGTLDPQSFAYDANNRLLSDRYDANGNTTNAFVTTPLTGQTNEVFDQFDFEDRLFERTTTLNAQAATINVLYDGDGHRVAKGVVTGTNRFTTLYVVDDLNPTGYAQVLEELTSANGEGFGVTRVYTWGHALLSQDQFTSGQWNAHFAGHDGQGSVRYLTDASGVITDAFDYDAFGNLIARSGTTPNNHLFRGEQFDPDLNLYYLRARYHNPATGRFWTPDSFEGFATDPASLHHYTFNQNDPVNRLDPSGHISLAENLQVSGLAPIVRGAFLSLWDGVNNYSYGMAGGNTLKFTAREEAYFIDSLAAGPGWKFGKENFWAAARGAPFLLNQNPNIWQGRKPCWYECIPFDQDMPVYGPGAQFPIFEFGESPLYGLVEKIGYYGTAPVRFAGGVGVAAGVAGKGFKDLLINTGGAVSYTVAAGVYGPESAEKFFGQQADATVALATGLGRLSVAASTFGYQPLLDAVAPEFAAEQRTLLKGTAQSAFNSSTGGDAEFAGLGWEFRAGYTAFNLLGLVQGTAEVTQALKAAKAARLSARMLAAETASEMSAMRALRINKPALETAEAATALTGPTQAGCRAARPSPIIDLVRGPDGVYVPVTELKSQRLLTAPAEAARQLEFGIVPFVERQTLARNFYRAESGWADSRIAGHMKGIDFNHPVDVVQIPRGAMMNQHGFPGDPKGNYFALPGTPAKGLGIYPHGRLERFYEATADFKALRSIAADVTDTWSIPNWAIDVPGGNTQFFVPQKGLMQAYP